LGLNANSIVVGISQFGSSASISGFTPQNDRGHIKAQLLYASINSKYLRHGPTEIRCPNLAQYKDEMNSRTSASTDV
jgi:hypothetical protein